MSSTKLGPEGGKAIADMLKTNTTLTSLKYDEIDPSASDA